MTTLLVVAACAFLNRMAGGGWPSDPARWYDALTGRIACAVYLGLVSLALHDWPAALAFGAGFLFWRAFSWGYLVGAIAGGHVPARKPNPVEGRLLDWFGPHGGMIMRMAFVLPTLIAVGWLTGTVFVELLVIPFSVLAMLAYVVAWRLYPQHVFRVAEPLVGALWGALVVITA